MGDEDNRSGTLSTRSSEGTGSETRSVGPPSGTVTFLFTDIEGSTRRWERSRDAMDATVAAHDDLLREIIGARRGYVFKMVGDACCAAFSRPEQAVASAIEIQRGLADARWNQDDPVQVRIAVHSGAAEERDSDYFGPPVNRVARLLSAGHGGQILVSLATQQLCRDMLPHGATLVDLGEHRLKDLSQPEHIYGLKVDGLAWQTKPPRTLDHSKINLPIQLTSFVGRDRELKDVGGLLRDPAARLVTLRGPGGVGKTRLALEAAAQAHEWFPDGICLTELAAVAETVQVPTAIRTAMGIQECGADEAEAIAAFISDKRILLIADNLEHLLRAGEALVELLRSCPSLKILVTSRTTLGQPGEHVLAVNPMSTPAAARQVDSAVRDSDAVRLFCARAKEADASLTLSDVNIGVIAEICRRLDGLPLAIELAAARVTAVPLKTLSDLLAGSLRVLGGRVGGRAPHQQTLRSTIEWSVGLLSEPQRTLFARLGAFAGGWSLEAAEAICDLNSDIDVFDELASLVTSSLALTAHTDVDGARYVFLQPIRGFAAEMLSGGDEVNVCGERHAGFFAHLAGLGATAGDDELTAWLRRIDVDYDNIRLALEWYVSRRAAEPALQFVLDLFPYWNTRCHYTEARSWFDRVLALRSGGPVSRSKALESAGTMAIHQSDLDGALRLYQESVALARDAKDHGATARASMGLARVLLYRREYAQGVELAQESLMIFRDLGEPREEAQCLLLLAALADHLERYEEAGEYNEHALEIARSGGDQRGILVALVNAGASAMIQRKSERAELLLNQSLQSARETGNPLGMGLSASNLGFVSLDRERYQEAGARFAEAIDAFEGMDAPELLVTALEGVSIVLCATGNMRDGARMRGFMQSWRAAAQIPLEPFLSGRYQAQLSDAEQELGDARWKTESNLGAAMRLDAVVALARAALHLPPSGD